MDRLAAMETFVRIVEAGSLSAAARQLSTTQPSVSRQLRALERRLKSQLLRRSTRHVSLTESGLAFFHDCKRILADVDEAEGTLGSLHSSLQGTLKVNTLVALGVDYIAPLACAFQQLHPELVVDLTLNARMVDLVEEGIDLAIRFGPVRDENLVARKLATIRCVTIAAPSYLRRHGTPSRPEELPSHVCVALNYTPVGTEWCYEGPRGEVRVRVTSSFRSNNGHVLRGAILAGMGIGWLPEPLVHQQLKSGALKAVLPSYVMPALDVHAVYSSARHTPIKVRAFVDYLEARLAKLPGFAGA